MDKQLLTKVNGEIKKYDIIIDFTSNDTNKNYVFYTDNTKNEKGELIIYMGSYIIEDDLYVINPIETDEEKELCNNILRDLKEENNK